MTEQELAEIEKRWSKASKGAWIWEVNPKYHTVSLKSRGGMVVMDFVRWGMGSAAPRFLDESHLLHRVDKLMEPIPGREHHSHWAQQINHPDALAIAAAPEDARSLIAEVRRLNAEVERLKKQQEEFEEEENPDGNVYYVNRRGDE